MVHVHVYFLRYCLDNQGDSSLTTGAWGRYAVSNLDSPTYM